MPEISIVDPDDTDRENNKCSACNYRYSTLYRFDDEPTHLAVCGDCFTRFLIEDGYQIQEPTDE